MSFILAPASSQPFYNPSGFCSSAIRPAYRHRGLCFAPRRPQYPSFHRFLSHFDELLSEASLQAQQQTRKETQQPAQKPAPSAHFTVHENELGWRIDGEMQGFKQGHLRIELANDHTLKITGDTESSSNTPLFKSETPIERRADDGNDDKTLAEKTPEPAAPAKTNTEATMTEDIASHKSYQATVDDDFEDLGAETSSLISASSESSAASEAVMEPKGKEKAVQAPIASESKVAERQDNTGEAGEEKQHRASFERTYTFRERINAANVHASFDNGTLSITVPRAPVQQSKTIVIA